MASFRKSRGKYQTKPVTVPRAGVTRRDLPEPKPQEELNTHKVKIGAGTRSIGGVPVGELSGFEAEMERRLNLTPEEVSQEIERDRRALATPSVHAGLVAATQLRQQRTSYDSFGEAAERCRLEQQDWGGHVPEYQINPDGRSARRPQSSLGVFHGVDGTSGMMSLPTYQYDPRLRISATMHVDPNAGNPLALAAAAWIDQAVRRHLPEAVNIMEERYQIRLWQTSFIIVPDGCPALVGRFENVSGWMVVAGINLRNMHMYEPVEGFRRHHDAAEQFEMFLVRMITRAIPALQGVIRP